MLKIIIPIFAGDGALRAAEHVTRLAAENCRSDLTLVEVLNADEHAYARDDLLCAPAYQERERLDGIVRNVCDFLREADIDFNLTRRVGARSEVIAEVANSVKADLVLLDTTSLSAMQSWWMVRQIQRHTDTSITIVH